MVKILFYNFWEEKEKRKPIAKFRSFDEIKIENVKQDTTNVDLKDQIVILQGHRYKIVSTDNAFKKGTISDHHKTNDEMVYEILIELVE